MRRLLLDECIDRRLKRELTDHYVRTVPQNGWAGIKNGELMTLAQNDYDVFITVDRNLSYQQNLPSYDLAVIVLRSKSNRYSDLQVFAPTILSAIDSVKPGDLVIIP